MRKVVLYIGMSLDGYIADENGKVDWMRGHDENSENADTWSEFIKDMDIVVMGWKTYHQIITELSPEKWVYEGLKSYIITHREEISTDEIIFTHESPCDLVRRLREEPGKDIWICGGAAIVNQLMKENLIDVYYISVIPTILGKGIRLFQQFDQEIRLSLMETRSQNGITALIYGRDGIRRQDSRVPFQHS